MKRLKNITILLCFLSLLAFISCSAEDKTGIKNNPPENDTEITDGETGSGGTGSGNGSTSGGSSETETGGETGGSEEGEGGTEIPPTEPETPPSETETTKTIEEKDFPPELLGTYRDERIYNMYKNSYREEDDAKVSSSGIGIWMKGTQMRHKKDGSADGTQSMDIKIKKWKKTTKGGKIIKLEGESFSTQYDFDTGETTTVAKTVIIYDYENKTVSMTFTTYIPDGVDASFYGKKID